MVVKEEFDQLYDAAMFPRKALSCATLLLTVAAPVFAQDVKSSTASEDVIQDPMPRSKAAALVQNGPAQPQPAQAQASKPAEPTPAAVNEKAAPKSTFSINPAMLLLGGIGAEFETAVDPSISLFVAPSGIFGNALFASQPGLSTSGFGLDLGLRYFASQEAPKGFWVGPYAGLASVNATAGTLKVNATSIGFGGMLGYSWITNGFYFSLGAGGGYRAVMADAGSSTNAAAAGGAALTLRLAIGFAQ